ncbi:hypothetical protein EMIHUDRAFT_468471 [Emiliania huxleyi CCMP1516]|uniref:EamA domain-containing protein n=2 Tax=Emiliania huxleyi TaxID=2903 RepID=A0A0D3K247_EMIH1|nr:hypothetical protein EMIHUDRAFT_468471 [Emiliania huxleyi CCMP1516]EOD29832.1 hypothetical protein EMIHUDRAFT_468471 [Emiliania huxleyi CCMP1516]|eukprot:XP_005782261.1 hypothetical protein EMIHUDRAFT_468471 [Emiliania huxleyi CCMP1516]
MPSSLLERVRTSAETVRPTFLFFRGSTWSHRPGETNYGEGVRLTLQRALSTFQLPRHISVERSLSPLKVTPRLKKQRAIFSEDPVSLPLYLEEMSLSDFCLCPMGSTSWTLRISSAGHRPPTAAFPDEPLRPKAGAAAMGVAALLVAGYLLLGKRHVSSSWHTSHVFPRVGGVTGTSYQRVFHYLNSVLFIWGFKLSTPFFASVAQLSIPVMTFVYTALAGLEVPTCLRTTGVCLIVLGCLLTALGSAHHEHAPAAGAAAGAAGSGSPPVPASLWVGAGFLPLQSASCRSWGLTWRRGTDRVGVGCLALQTGSFSGLLVLQKALVQAYPVALVVAWGYSAGCDARRRGDGLRRHPRRRRRGACPERQSTRQQDHQPQRPRGRRVSRAYLGAAAGRAA